jgi:hypothetical protein
MRDIYDDGIAPVNETLIGMTANMKPEQFTKWQGKLRRMGYKAE